MPVRGDEQPPGAAAAALDEVLERVAARHHEAQVLGEYRPGTARRP